MYPATLLLCVWSGLSITSTGGGGMPYVGPGRDFVVATVNMVSKDAVPKVELTVHEVLRGEPKMNRSKAVWLGPPVSLDQRLPTPHATPIVGRKYILSGDVRGKGKKQAFEVAHFWRYEFTADNLATVKKFLADEAAAEKAALEKAAAEARARAEASAAWRARFSNDRIEQHVKQADCIAVGKIVSEGFNPSPQVNLLIHTSGILKGTWRRAGPSDYLSVSVPRTLWKLMDRETSYILFLSEHGLLLGPSETLYPLIPDGDAVVVADEAAMRAVKEALQAQVKPVPRPLVVMEVKAELQNLSHYHKKCAELSDVFDKTAGTRAAAVRSQFFTAPPVGQMSDKQREWIADVVRERVPGTDFVLLVQFDERAQPPHRLSVTAIRFEAARATIVLAEQWQVKDDREIATRAAEVMTRLLKNP